MIIFKLTFTSSVYDIHSLIIYKENTITNKNTKFNSEKYIRSLSSLFKALLFKYMFKAYLNSQIVF